jgi:hypothetical protein
VFGLSWEAPPPEREAVRAFLTYLEDRRVLFVPYILEVEDQVHRSVLDIRGRCTAALVSLPEGSHAADHIRAIRAACRRFMTEPRPDFRNAYHWRGDGHGQAGFFTALGELRAAIGTRVAALALTYGVEIEGELASVLPALDDGGPSRSRHAPRR